MHNKRICFNLKRLRAIPPKKYIVTSVVFVCFVASVLISLFQSPYTKEEVYEKKVLINHIHFSQISSKGLSVSDVQIILYGDDANYYAYIDYKIFDSIRDKVKRLSANLPAEILVTMPADRSIIDNILNRNNVVSFRTESEQIYSFEDYQSSYNASILDWVVVLILGLVLIAIVIFQLLAYGVISFRRK